MRKILLKVKDILKSILPKRIWNFLRNNRLREKFRKMQEEKPYRDWVTARKSYKKEINEIPYKDGVNIIGYLSADNGLGEAARGTIRALERSNIQFHAFNMQHTPSPGQEITKINSPFSGDFPYKINIIHINPEEFINLWDIFPAEILAGRYNIAVWYWELPEFPDKWIKFIDLVDEIWVATEFVRESIQKKTSIPVRIIPPAINVKTDKSLSRSDFGLPEDVFLFLCAYDTYSIQARKNPMAAVDAFINAFSDRQEDNIGLVVKINHADYNRKEIDELKKKLSVCRHVYFFEESFPREKFNSLIDLIDAYISLHRSEGFGLIPAESMFLGKPVIMTNWSGNLDFTRSDNSCPVDYKLIPVGKGIDVYDSRQSWADPDVYQAVEYMKKLIRDKMYYRNISQNAAKSIRELYGPDVISGKIEGYIHSLLRQ